jgi:uncharacterized membrane protein
MPQNDDSGKGLRPLLHCRLDLSESALVQNGHPLVIHFPLAFLTASALAVLAGTFVRAAWLAPFARVSLYLGTLAAIVAVISGFFALQTVAKVAAASDELAKHQTFGYATLAVSAALSAWSLVARRRGHATPRPTALWTLGNALLLVAVFVTGMEGGELVHDYGVGTALTAPSGPLHEGESAAAPPARDSVPTARDFR